MSRANLSVWLKFFMLYLRLIKLKCKGSLSIYIHLKVFALFVIEGKGFSEVFASAMSIADM
jgi:hypothetical protein